MLLHEPVTGKSKTCYSSFEPANMGEGKLI